MTRRCLLIIVAFVALAAAPAAYAEAPPVLSYQGFLTDSVGNPVTGEWTLTFGLYGQSTGGEALFVDSQDVTTDKGLFSLYLGSEANPLPVETLGSGELYLEIIVETDDGPIVLEPRAQVVSDPYALFSNSCENANQLGGQAADAFVTVQQLPDVCIAPEDLPDLLIELGYLPGGGEGLDEAALAGWMLANGYSPCVCYGDDDVASYLDVSGYTSGPHFSGNYADLADTPDLTGFMTEPDVMELLGTLGAVLLADGSVALEGPLDFAGFEAINLVVEKGTIDDPPDEITSGQLWFDTTNKKLRIWDGVEWAVLGADTIAADLSCPECVDADDVSFSFAAADQKGGAALAVSCFQCISGDEVDFAWALGVTPGGAAEHALTADLATSAVVAEDLACPGCVSADDLDPAVMDSSLMKYDGAKSGLASNHVQGAIDELAAGGMGGGFTEGNGTIVPYVEQWGISAYGTAKTHVHLMNPSTPKVLMHLYADDSASFASSNNLVVAYAFSPNQYSAGAIGTVGEAALQVTNPSVFNSGSHIMVHQTIGGPGATAGTWELSQVKTVNGSTLQLLKPLAHTYVSNGTARAQVVLAASFGNVEIVNGGTLRPALPLAADGSMGGIVYVRANKLTVKSGGRVDADGMGFPATTGGYFAPGSSECGPGIPGQSEQNCSGGAGGAVFCANGGGGGNRTAGGNGSNHANCATQSEGGAAKGDANLTTLEFGGAGGTQYEPGGAGGGIVVIGAQAVIVQEGGRISANGMNAADRGSGGGAGGTIALYSDFFQVDGEVFADGGEGGEVIQWTYIEPVQMAPVLFNTHSHGGGYSPKYLEFWYPEWSGTTIYRFNREYEPLGMFASGNNDMMQLWGDTDGTYYTANWGQDRVRKWNDMGNNQLWEYHLGSTTGAVCSDENYVYAMRHSGGDVYKLNKASGQHIETFSLPSTGSTEGMACTPGRIYYTETGGMVKIYNLDSNQKIGEFNVGSGINNMSFDGQILYTSPNSNTVARFKLLEGNIYEPAGSGGDGGDGWVLEKSPMAGIINESYPKGIEIWVDGQEVTPLIGDPNAMGDPAWDAADEKWGKDGLSNWSTGQLDLSSVANWTLGEHTIQVTETGGAGGDIKMYAYVIYPFTKSAAPVNDTCAQPVMLDLSQQVTVTGTTEDVMGKIKATDDNEGPFCGGSGGPDVVYGFVLDDWRQLTVAVTAAFTPRVYIRKDDCKAGTVVACGNDQFTTGVFEPGTYYLVVDSDGNLQKGDFTLVVSPAPPGAPPNDTCATPEQLSFDNNVAQSSGMTLFSIDQYSAVCGGAGAPENVFQFLVPAGIASLGVALEADFAPAMYVVKDNCGGAPMACIPAKTYQMNWPGPGNYFLFVDGKTANDKGLYTLTVTLAE